jgi:hypothetical protein
MPFGAASLGGIASSGHRIAAVTTHIELTDPGDGAPVLVSIQAINYFSASKAGEEGVATRLNLDGWDEEFEVFEAPDQVAQRVGQNPEGPLLLPLTLAEGGTKLWVNASKVATFQPEEDGTTTLAFATLADDIEVRESLPVIRDMLVVLRRPTWLERPFGSPPLSTE